MARPGDRGDQFPSDDGDVAPLNKAIGLTQRDFDPTFRPGKFNIRDAQHAYNISTGVPPQGIAREHAWAGLIQSHVGFTGFYHEYRVFRQDGKVVTAFHVSHNDAPTFDIQETVFVVQDLDEATFMILGTPERKPDTLWAVLTTKLDPRPTVNFGAVSSADAELYYFTGTTYEQDANTNKIKVINPTTNSWAMDDVIQVRLVTEKDSNNDTVYEPVGAVSEEKGIALVTTEISAATFNKLTKVLTHGSGTVTQFIKDEGANSHTLGTETFTVYTTVEEATPVDKIIHWKTIDGERMLVLEPCKKTVLV